MSHYYDSSGNACHYQTTKTGKQRGTSVTDAKRLGLVPSVTTVNNVIGKEAGLKTYWQMNVLDAAQQTPYVESVMNYKDWQFSMMKHADSHMKEAQERGSAIHKLVEDYLDGKEMEHEDTSIHQAAITALQALNDDVSKIKETEWVGEESFIHSGIGYGGSVDIHTKEGDGIVVDLKCKFKADLSRVTQSIENKLQLVAYAYGLGIPDARLYNLYVSSHEDGAGRYRLFEMKSQEVKRYWKMFRYILGYWKARYDYDPGKEIS